jgi:hypothetical protein
MTYKRDFSCDSEAKAVDSGSKSGLEVLRCAKGAEKYKFGPDFC